MARKSGAERQADYRARHADRFRARQILRALERISKLMSEYPPVALERIDKLMSEHPPVGGSRRNLSIVRKAFIKAEHQSR